MIVTGERRYRAAKALGLETVPVKVVECAPGLALAGRQLSENITRADLNPIEIARALAAHRDATGMTGGAIARMLGKSESWAYHYLTVLTAPAHWQEAVENKEMSVGYANFLMHAKDRAVAEAVFEERHNITKHDSIPWIIKALSTGNWSHEEFHAFMTKKPTEGQLRTMLGNVMPRVDAQIKARLTPANALMAAADAFALALGRTKPSDVPPHHLGRLCLSLGNVMRELQGAIMGDNPKFLPPARR